MVRSRTLDEKLHREATKLEFDPKYHSRSPKEGYISIQMGMYRDEKVHRKIVDLLSQAMDAAPEIDYYQFLRAGLHLGTRNFTSALSDYEAVSARGMKYALAAKKGMVSLYLAQGQIEEAVRVLAHVNFSEREQGEPPSQLSEYEII